MEGATKEQYRVFHPGERSMKDEFPELQAYEEFRNMNNARIKFCYYMANSSSPMKGNIQKSIAESGISNSISHSEKIRILDRDFPDDIAAGIGRMESFIPSNRVKAVLAMQAAFDNMCDILVSSPGSSIDDMKKYADAVKSAEETIPKLLQQLEQGFGVKRSKSKTGAVSVLRVADERKIED